MSKIKAPADVAPCEDLLPCSQMVFCSVCLHLVEGESNYLQTSFYQGTNPIHMGSTLVALVPPKASPPNAIHGVLDFNYELWGQDTNVQLIANETVL